MSEKIKATGEIVSISNYSGSHNGWKPFRIKENETEFLIDITGCLPESVGVGDIVSVSGQKEFYRGREKIAATEIVPQRPDENTAAGVKRLLMKLPGIGEKTAQWAIEKYGHEMAWNHALNNPLLLKVPPVRVELFKEEAAKLLVDYDDVIYMLSIGLTDHQVGLIQKSFRGDTVEVIKNTPYKLLNVDGFGFKTVDKIALKSGARQNAPARIEKCIEYFLLDNETNGGNIFMFLSKLVLGAKEMLKGCVMSAELPFKDSPDKDSITASVWALNGHTVHIDKMNGRVFSLELLRAERVILNAVGVTSNLIDQKKKEQS